MTDHDPTSPPAGDSVALDKRHCWHPFTAMQAWCAPGHEPLVIARGEGVWLFDDAGRRYLDGNSSIWTNIHGHAHPRLNAALRGQAERIAHSSFLGFTHPLAGRLAARLSGFFPDDALQRVFFSDDGSTAIEVALKISAQYWQLSGHPERSRFVSFTNAYHGDTTGAASLGGISLFHGRFAAQHFPVRHVGSVAELDALPAVEQDEIAAVIIEPLIQGAAGMRLWPAGMLAELRAWTAARGIHLILDEVMTGFGRTGKMFACQQENVVPDFLCLAKGLTGGYLPMAATLTRESIFEAFLGDASRVLYYGHSYTANPLGCAAALASLEIFEEERTLDKLTGKIDALTSALEDLQRTNPRIGEVRQCGFMAGIDVVQENGEAFPPSALAGAKACLAAREYGLLTRPIRDTLVLMLPLCATVEQVREAVRALDLGIRAVPGN